MKKLNGYVKNIGIGLAVAGIIWNAAILHNDVRHLKEETAIIREEIQKIQTFLLEHER